jgi:predicted  nucleic acid-binding Zn-ribbon protein
MKNLTVRLSDLDHKRLTEQAIKKGGTISDAMRDIVNQFFDKQSQAQSEKSEHEKTRAKFSDIDSALANQVQDFQAMKAGLNHLSNLIGQFIAAKQGAQK